MFGLFAARRERERTSRSGLADRQLPQDDRVEQREDRGRRRRCRARARRSRTTRRRDCGAAAGAPNRRSCPTRFERVPAPASSRVTSMTAPRCRNHAARRRGLRRPRIPASTRSRVFLAPGERRSRRPGRGRPRGGARHAAAAVSRRVSDCRARSSPHAGFMTRAMTSTIWFQRDCSAASCFLPAGGQPVELGALLVVASSSSRHRSSPASRAGGARDRATRDRPAAHPRSWPGWRRRCRGRAAAPTAGFAGSACRACPARARCGSRIVSRFAIGRRHSTTMVVVRLLPWRRR